MTLPAFRPPTQFAFYAAYALYALPEIADAVRRDDGLGPDLDARSKHGIYAAVAASVAVGFALGPRAPAWATFGALAVPLFAVGLACVVCGVALRWYSVAILGDAFSRVVTVRDGQGVVDDGPYGVVRHPTYAGGLLALVGFGLAFGTWPALLVAVAAGGLAYGYRIRVEERALRAELDGYADYCERVPDRLVPGVY
ncbi:methyltransferase family protein [Halocalculus aciditolerans]|uniref:Isoprenylcysteine carboxylmethyltransferase family protein n=1 Tax=Halocalculus aciditolerans TaxID=1383812 RepID=A0A830F6E0_9EURY|nr:isoprenylcysteine carboxylmethyltransferase family protein [Halocalculus aciditolerans]GGL58982.1 hypothetical protein GCM10009039_16520 [Halocalculus aciditolerans]